MNFKKIFILLICLMGVLNVNAATISFEKSNVSITEKSSEQVKINIKIDTDEKVERVEFTLNYNNELVTVKPIDNENGYAQAINNNVVLILDPTDDNSKPITDGIIYTFNVTNNSSIDDNDYIEISNLKINSKVVEDEIRPLNLTLKKLVTTTTRALNIGAKLDNFTVTNATVKPAFSKDIKEYKIYVNKDTIKQVTIKPEYTSDSAGASMDVNCTLGCVPDNKVPNKLNLVMGKNEVTFTITSEDGKNKEDYKFIIYRGETTDGSNMLSSIDIEGFTLNEKFDRSTLDYTLKVPFETEKLNITAKAEDENAKVEIQGADKLELGENVITITVTSAETEEKKIYNITVTKEEFVPEEDNKTNITPAIEKEPVKKSNLKLIIIIAVVSTLIIGLSAYFIFFRKKKTKKTNIPELKKDVKTNNALINEELEPTNIDDALKDLMDTKEIK